MKTRRSLIAVAFTLALVAAAAPASADWTNPIGGPGQVESTADLMVQAAALGFQLSQVAL